MQERHINREMYFHDLEVTSKEFYISYLSNFIRLTPECKILEVGCGEGGNLAPFVELGCKVTGVDISECKIDYAQSYSAQNHNATFVCCDFMQYAAPKSEDDKYDIILLHDVIEHIPEKESFVLHIKKFLKPEGVFFIGFPAWQMPFGGHQQICRSKLCSHLPFIHLLPNPLYRALLRLCKEEDGTIKEMMSVKECRTSIELFERLVKTCGFAVADHKLWFINPHYKQKFHLTPRLLPRWMWKIRYIRNFFTTSCWYILKIDNK